MTIREMSDGMSKHITKEFSVELPEKEVTLFKILLDALNVRIESSSQCFCNTLLTFKIGVSSRERDLIEAFLFELAEMK